MIRANRFPRIALRIARATKYLPKGPSRTVFSTESDSVVFCYSVVNLLRIVIHYSKYSRSVHVHSDSLLTKYCKSVQHVVIHYIFTRESVRVVISLQIANSRGILFLACRGPLAFFCSGGPLVFFFRFFDPGLRGAGNSFLPFGGFGPETPK